MKIEPKQLSAEELEAIKKAWESWRMPVDKIALIKTVAGAKQMIEGLLAHIEALEGENAELKGKLRPVGYHDVTDLHETQEPETIREEFEGMVRSIDASAGVLVKPSETVIDLWVVTDTLNEDFRQSFCGKACELMRKYPRLSLDFRMITPDSAAVERVKGGDG